MHLSSLRIYPVKSLRGVDAETAVVEPWGLQHDRRWMVVDGSGTTVTARENHRMLMIAATWHGDSLALSAQGHATLRVAEPVDTERVAVDLSRVGHAIAATDEADTWMSTVLGQPVRLVYLDDPRRRTLSPEHGGHPSDRLSLADAGPVHLTTTASLEQLNRWLLEVAGDRGEPRPDPLTMIRFRPNVVIDGCDEAFVEDGWKELRIGAVDFRFGEHCDRCVLPTINPETGRGGKEPTRTLAVHRQWDHQVYFGIRLIPVSPGRLHVGDAVTVP
ncbi:MAG: MOSC domain-containing protein [Nocardioidaceae bacterium]